MGCGNMELYPTLEGSHLNNLSHEEISYISEDYNQKPGNSASSSPNNSITVPPPIQTLPQKLSFQLPKPRKFPIKYIEGQILGTGAFGKVYSGIDQETGNLLAIKHLNIQFIKQEQKQEIYNEITYLANLRHPYIVKIFDYQETNKTIQIYLERLSTSIQSLTKKFNGLPEPLIKQIGLQLAEAVSYLHSNDVSHCDIKCANIMFNDNQELKLVDFGSAIQSQIPISGIRGSPYWLAPEILQNSSYDPKAADVWSFGATIYEMYCGQPLFSQFKSAPAVMYFLSQNKQIPEINFGSDKLKKLLKKIFQPVELRITMQEVLSDAFFSGQHSQMINLNVQEDCELNAQQQQEQQEMNILQESIIGKKTIQQVLEKVEDEVKQSNDLLQQSFWGIVLNSFENLFEEHNKDLFKNYCILQ
ncbi:Kinase, STE STE11 [Spironucleus salmonicida]|uniref:Kinase, STE STE11 n=1 Tax=Spironucleus salmonicida TaxID=348837 RepID=V6LE57_9EUKA|nr:Kinase, STE STE11 [Spironucleus salmonicida]|eukprot:EST42563.1 Kinase, STE STE11 [Spironucleus salmonicida]